MPGFILDFLFEISFSVLLVDELGQLAIKPQVLHTLPMFARFNQIKFSTNAIHFNFLLLDQLMQPYINTRLLNFVLTNLLSEPTHNNAPFSLDELHRFITLFTGTHCVTILLKMIMNIY